MSNNQSDSCLLVKRRVEQLQEHSVTCTKTTQRRVLADKSQEMHQYISRNETPEVSQNSYVLDDAFRSTLNGHQDHSPNSSIQGSENPTLSRHQPQKTQVTSVTKIVREVHHMGPDNSSDLDFISTSSYQPDMTSSNMGIHSPYGYAEHHHPVPPEQGSRRFNDPYHHPSYQDYETYPNSGQDYGTVYNSMHMSGIPSDHYQTYGNSANYADHSQYGERPPTPPSASERSDSPPPQQHLANDYMRKIGCPPSGYDELDSAHTIPRAARFRVTPSPAGINDRFDQMSSSWEDGISKPLSIRHETGLKWRDPNFTEVISFLTSPNDSVKANAAAYLQHLCYMDDLNKQKMRTLGGIPPLVKLLAHENPVVFRNACGALRNLSYGRQNDENKRVIKHSGGVLLLVNSLRKIQDSDLRELVTGVMWNLSSCEDLKKSIIDDGLTSLVNCIIIPHSGWSPTPICTTSSDTASEASPTEVVPETCWSNVFRNTTGILRNISSAGEYARKRLRECEGLVDALFHTVRSAIDKSTPNNKSVENSVCILRNLSYRCQEVEDPNYDKNPVPVPNRVAANAGAKGENPGCFGGSKKKKEVAVTVPPTQGREPGIVKSTVPCTDPATGMQLLWQPEVVQIYLALLQSCSNTETLEASAGAIQNLAACYWDPSIEIRAAVRKEKGLPILVELLRMEVDRVVCALATALRNLAIDTRNKELIGKYAMRDLVQKLPSGSPQHDQATSDDTIAAVLATLNEVVKKNAEFSRSLLEASGVDRLMNITKQKSKYTPRVLKFASQVLYTMWQHQELREVYRKQGWKEQDFVTKTIAARNSHPHSPGNANNTLNRPMASQSGTRYEDRTMQRPQPLGESSSGRCSSHTVSNYHSPNDEIPLADMSYPDGVSHAPPIGGVRIFPPGTAIKPGEPLYAQVNREKKKNRQYEGLGGAGVMGSSVGSNETWPTYDEQSHDHRTASMGSSQNMQKGMVIDPKNPAGGGDSWV